MTRNPVTNKMVNPDDIRILSEPDGLHRGNIEPGTIKQPHHGRPQKLIVERLKGVQAPAGQSIFLIEGGSYKGNRQIAASSMGEAVKIAKEGTPNRVARMMELWSFGTQVERRNIGKMAEIVGRRISWATPALKQTAKGIGIPMAVAAVIGGAMYGADYLAKKLGEKQRDLIAESAALAWGTFAASNYVRVGSEQVRIDQLPEVVAVQFFQAFVAQSILRFQKSTYE
jgi:hypothetical protein